MKTKAWSFSLGAMLVASALLHPVAMAANDGRNASVSEGGQKKTVQQGRRVALVMGNFNYSKLNRLDNPKNDVTLMENTLRELGFTEIIGGTRRGLNLSNGDMHELLEEFARKSISAEVAVIFFAGHGLVSKSDNEQYLAAVETSNIGSRLHGEAMSLTTIMDKLSNSGAQKNFVFLDACRETARGGGMRSVTPKRDADNTVILYATAADDVAADGKKGSNSPFTSALAAEIKQPNEWAVVQRNVINRVFKETYERQKPKSYGGLQDEMYFNVNITIKPDPKVQESEYWASIKDSKDIADFEAYLADFPNGQFKRLAENRIKALRKVAVPAVNPVVVPIPQASPAPVSIAPQTPTPVTAQPTIEIIDNRYQILANGAEVKDLQTNLIWQRCQVGMNWDGNTCYGKLEKFTLDEARKEEINGWRMPTIRELSSLIYCSSGKMKHSNNVGDGGAPIKHECDREYMRPTINVKAFPNTPASGVWSGWSNISYADLVWGVSFSFGLSFNGRRSDYHGVRLVRGGQ